MIVFQKHNTCCKTTDIIFGYLIYLLGQVAQSVTCLTTDPGVTSLTPVQSHNFMEIDNEIISAAFLLPSADSRMVVVIYKRKYMNEVLVNRLVKLAQEKNMVR